MKVKKQLLIAICFIQFIVLLGDLGVILWKEKNPTQIDFDLSKMRSKYISYENNEWYADDNVGQITGDCVLIYGPYMSLKRGSYTLSIQYGCQSDQSVTPFSNTGKYSYLKAGKVILSKNQNAVSYDFSLTENIKDFELQFRYNGSGSFSVKEISLQTNTCGFRRVFVYLLCFFAIIDIVLAFYETLKSNKNTILALFGIVCLASMPLASKGIGTGHDMYFHLLRIEGIAEELKLGNFPVRLSSLFMDGHGYPVSIYYGDLFLYFPVLLRFCGFSIVSAYKIFLFFINLGTVFISYLCFKRIFENKKIALITCMAYTCACYRIINIYVRAAVGEYTAMMFLPLIALAVYQIYTEDETDWKCYKKSALLLALGMSGLMFCHVLSVEITVIVLLIVCVAFWKKTFRKNTLKVYLIAIFETLLLSMFFIVPFLDYYKNVPVNITDIVSGSAVQKIQHCGVRIASYFAFFKDIYGISYSSLEDNHTLQLTPGIVLMATLLIAVILCLSRKVAKEIKFFTVFSLLLLYVASDLFPWDFLSANLKIGSLKIGDALAQVQFPWRYLEIALVILALLLGMLLKRLGEFGLAKREKEIYCMIAGASVIMLCYLTGNYLDDGGSVCIYDTAEITTYAIGNGEYLRSGSEEDNLSTIIASTDVEQVYLEKRRGSDMQLYCETKDKPGTVQAPLFHYKGYTVTDEQGNKLEIMDGNNCLVKFEMPASYAGKIYIEFKEPWYWRMAECISLLTVIYLCIRGGVLFYANKKRKNENQALIREAFAEEKNTVDTSL